MNMSQVPSILAFVYTVRSATAPAASPRHVGPRSRAMSGFRGRTLEAPHYPADH